MKKSGRVIWLNTGIDTLVERLIRQKSHRPVIKFVPNEELEHFIRKKMQERRLYYEQADRTVKEDELTEENFLEELMD